MADVFQEVDEIMKQERLQKFWNEYAPWIIAFVVLTILFTAGLSMYRSWNASLQEKQTATLIQATESENFAGNIETLTEGMRPDIRAVALMNAATKYIADDNTGAALPLYEQVRNDRAVEEDLRDLATLFSVRAALATQAEPDLKALLSKLETLWRKDESPWKYHAHLETALAQANYNNDYETARTHLKELLSAENLPSSLYEKASALDHIYALKVGQKSETSDNNGEG